ncbi:MAG: hypothetical protein IPP93_09015 [Chitinophagaceae bacterium]|nr:hypothetical protein [Chitinophagaceae bacterium]MBL0335877.1 hypothetical protein [Chitinophagaceae bacterium]
MLCNKTILGIVLVTTAVFILPGCYKDKTVVFDTGAEITRPVTFANDVIPIFNKSCSLSGCHAAGGKSPDLTAPNAFNSLSAGNYFDINNPQASLIYLWLTGKKSTPMPVGGINKDYNAMVLAWIKQGAKNN